MNNYDNKLVVLPTDKCRGAVLIPDLGIEVSFNTGTVIDSDQISNDLQVCIIEGILCAHKYDPQNIRSIDEHCGCGRNTTTKQYLYNDKLYYLRSPKFDEIPQHDSTVIDTTIAETNRALTILEGTTPTDCVEMREIDNHHEAIAYSKQQYEESTPEEKQAWQQGLDDVVTAVAKEARRAKIKRIFRKLFNFLCGTFLVGFLILVILALVQAYSQ